MLNLYSPVLSLFISLVLCFVYFSQKKINSHETKIYSVLLIIAIIQNVVGTIIITIAKGIGTLDILYILNKIDFALIYGYMLFLYVYVLLYTLNKNSVIKIFLYIASVLSIGITFIIIFTPVEIINFGDVYNTDGLAPNMIVVSAVFYGIQMILFIIYGIIKRKSVDKKFVPILIFWVLMILAILVRVYIPAVLAEPIIFAFVNLIMYFTIENPDIKMIKELNMAKSQAMKANAAKSEFLSNMSHEIRTPLNAVVGFSQALSEREVDESIRKDIDDIRIATDSLLEIVNGVLDISKIEANKLEIVKTEYKIQKILEELVSLTKGKLGDKPIEFKYIFDESIPRVLYGDYVRIKQIILNLLTNAVKYTENGYIEFKVSSIIKDDVCRLIISIEDSGIGIAKEKIDKLFNKFERVDLEKNISIEGTGLGLAITQRLVELMQGQIVVQSVYGKGSRFTVSIDQRVVLNPQSKDLEVTQAIKLDGTEGEGKKVLVVDDNKINLKVANRLLTSYGIEVEEVTSGQECLDKINQGNNYDMIFMDDMMPNMSGVDTFKILKQNPEFKIKTVALTANAISGMREKYLADGFDEYIPKPIERQELDRIVKKFLS